jgi:hypothetical protein
MNRDPLGIDAQLEAGLRRITAAIEHNRGQYARMVEEMVAATEAALGAASGERREGAPRPAERSTQRGERRRRREPRARVHVDALERADDAGVLSGVVFAVVAIVCLIFALRQPQFFWMVFVGLGFGLSAASAFSKAAARRRLGQDARTSAGRDATAETDAADVETKEPPVQTSESAPAADPPPPDDPTVARIQLLCDKLLAELESGPAIVREVVTDPRATIAGLRQACVETARRERDLRAVLEAQDEARLRAERDALAGRLSAEPDAIVRDRLGQALAALDQQLVHRAALATAAARLEAENTRILYTVENVHMQLLRARSTDMGAPELGGRLRDSLRELGIQIEAVAEALELADAPTSNGREAGGTARGTDEREAGDRGAEGPGAIADRERRDAARPAALARESQTRPR